MTDDDVAATAGFRVRGIGGADFLERADIDEVAELVFAGDVEDRTADDLEGDADLDVEHGERRGVRIVVGER